MALDPRRGDERWNKLVYKFWVSAVRVCGVRSVFPIIKVAFRVGYPANKGLCCVIRHAYMLAQ